MIDPESEQRVQEALGRDLLRTARLGATLMIAAPAAGLLAYVSLRWFWPEKHDALFRGEWTAAIVLMILGAAIALQVWLRWLLGLFLAKKTLPPLLLGFAAETAETLIPAAIQYIHMANIHPQSNIGLPATFAYYVLITLTVLRLNFWLSLYAGIASSIAYLAVAMLAAPPPHPVLGAIQPGLAFHLWQASLLIGTGLLTAVVAQQMRRYLLHALQSLEGRRRVLDVFGQHVSPQVVNHLLEQPVQLGGEVRHVCVMFLDIRNFTAFSSERSPEEVVGYLNDLFEFMVDSVNRHHGIVNKFLGDGFMAIFGAPVSDGRDSLNAVSAGQEIVQRLAKLNASRAGPATRIGIGLHAGPVVAGTVGSALRREYTIIGDTVNLASRIEALNKQFDSQFLLSTAVYEAVQHAVADAVCLGPVTIRGEEKQVVIYKLV